MRYWIFFICILLFSSCYAPSGGTTPRKVIKEPPRSIYQKSGYCDFNEMTVITRAWVYDTNTCKNVILYDSYWQVDRGDVSNWYEVVKDFMDYDYKHVHRMLKDYKGPFIKAEEAMEYFKND